MASSGSAFQQGQRPYEQSTQASALAELRAALNNPQHNILRDAGVDHADGLGLHESFWKHGRDGQARRNPYVDYDQSDSAKTSFWFQGGLVEGLVQLVTSAPNEPEGNMKIHYLLDPLEVQLNRMNVRTAILEAPVINSRTRIEYRERYAIAHTISCTVATTDDVAKSSVQSAGPHTQLILGNPLVYTAGLQVVDAAALFTRMWLIHIAICAGYHFDGEANSDNYSADYDPNVYVGLGPNELLAAGALDGVVVDGSALGSVGACLVAAACEWRLVDPPARLARYEFAPMEYYIANCRHANAYIDDADLTFRAICALADRLGARDQCIIAIETAVWLYGVSDPGRTIRLKQRPSRVVEMYGGGVHQTVAGMYLSETFGTNKLAIGSILIARAGEQFAAELLHESFQLDENLMDDAIALQLLSTTQCGLLKQVSSLWEEGIKIYIRPQIEVDYYFDVGLESIYNCKGRLANLALGLRTTTGITQMLSNGFKVPPKYNLIETANPFDRARKATGAEWFVIWALVERGLADIAHTTKFEARVGRQINMQAATALYAGSVIRFKLVGFGDHSTLSIGQGPKVSVPPAGGETSAVPSTTVPITQTPEFKLPVTYEQVMERVPEGRREPASTVVLLELLSQLAASRNVQQTPLSRGAHPHWIEIAEADPLGIDYELAVGDSFDHLIVGKAAAELVKEEWDVEATPGDGRCGLHAVSQALRNEGVSVSVEELENDLRQKVESDQQWHQEINPKGGVYPNIWHSEEELGYVAKLHGFDAVFLKTPTERSPRALIFPYERANRLDNNRIIPLLQTRDSHWENLARGGRKRGVRLKPK